MGCEGLGGQAQVLERAAREDPAALGCLLLAYKQPLFLQGSGPCGSISANGASHFPSPMKINSLRFGEQMCLIRQQAHGGIFVLLPQSS